MSVLETLNDEDQDTGDKPVYGIVTGTVSANNDPEKQGRVQVNINTFEDKHVTKWAPVATMMAGSGRGSLFLPDVDDEVLVAFEHGNLNAPYVVGSIWNGKSQPPDTEEGGGKGNNIRKIRSRSGHEVVFDDSDKKEKLEIKTNSGHKIVLDDEPGNEKVEIKDKSGNEIVIKTQDNSITIKCSGKITISAKKEVVIDAQAIKLGGSASQTLVTDAFIDLFNSHTHIGYQAAPTSNPTLHQALKNVHSTKITKGA
jgi:uncharacterized protein involved in type VI secretion and phage assembly